MRAAAIAKVTRWPRFWLTFALGAVATTSPELIEPIILTIDTTAGQILTEQSYPLATLFVFLVAYFAVAFASGLVISEFGALGTSLLFQLVGGELATFLKAEKSNSSALLTRVQDIKIRSDAYFGLVVAFGFRGLYVAGNTDVPPEDIFKASYGVILAVALGAIFIVQIVFVGKEIRKFDLRSDNAP